jgi:hypothetical protein
MPSPFRTALENAFELKSIKQIPIHEGAKNIIKSTCSILPSTHAIFNGSA